MSARILVVDDLSPNIKLLQAKLEAEYYEVVTAQSGREALEKVEQYTIDVILLDVMMPDMDGFETCRQLKSNPKTVDIPVVMVTALSDVDDRVEGLNAGANDFLTKPIDDLALFARIRSLVRLKSMTDELKLRDQTGGEILNQSINSMHGISIEDAEVLIVDDDVAQGQQIAYKLSEMGTHAQITTTSMEGVKKSEATDFDLIIVSAYVENNDGLHLCTHFRSQEITRDTPILILIEDNDVELLIKCFDIGVNDYLITPLDNNEIVARVKIQVRRKRYQNSLKASQRESLEMALTDGLTRLYNRRYFDLHLVRMLQSATDSGKPLALMMIDIDHFKEVNDTYGHVDGDDVLRQVASLIAVRPSDFVARYGGEEFAVVMVDTAVVNAAEIANRIRKKIEAAQLILTSGKTIQCTVSIGVTVSKVGDKPETLIVNADKALYHVKNSGRNRVAVYSDVPLQGHA